MVRWGEVAASGARAELARACFRPDIYRAALAKIGIDVPAIDFKSDGLHTAPYTVPGARGDIVMGSNAFFDGEVFDPAHIEAYMARQQVG